MKNEWEEIPPTLNYGKRFRPPYITFRPASCTIYFSKNLVKQYFGNSKYIKVRYHRQNNMLSFSLATERKGCYMMNYAKVITAVNIFKMLKKPIKEKTSIPVVYDREAKWLVIDLKKTKR